MESTVPVEDWRDRYFCLASLMAERKDGRSGSLDWIPYWLSSCCLPMSSLLPPSLAAVEAGSNHNGSACPWRCSQAIVLCAFMTGGANLPVWLPLWSECWTNSFFSLNLSLYMGMLRFCNSILSSRCELILIDYQFYWKVTQAAQPFTAEPEICHFTVYRGVRNGLLNHIVPHQSSTPISSF